MFKPKTSIAARLDGCDLGNPKERLEVTLILTRPSLQLVEKYSGHLRATCLLHAFHSWQMTQWHDIFFIVYSISSLHPISPGLVGNLCVA